jgi:hypothetical protein
VKLQLVVSAGFLLAACQTTGPDGVKIHASGNPAKDVAAVQAAVDAGGTVRLAGRFEFGERGRVVIRRSVLIVGEPGTRIQGGFWTFFSPLPEALPPIPGPKIAIRNIHFDGALWMPINIAYASDLEVTGNRITNVRPHPYPRPNLPNLQTMQGLMFGTFAAYADSTKRSYVPDAVTGPVVVADNIIDIPAPDPLNTLAQGIWGVWTTGIDARIERNRVSHSSRNGIEMIDNYRAANGKGRITIVENVIATPTIGVPAPTPRTPNGIVVGFFLDPASGANAARNSRYEVEENYVEVRGRNSIGIAVFSDGAEIRSNTISTTGADSSPILMSSSNGLIADNVFRGTGTNIVNLRPFREMSASGNRLAGNHLVEFKATAGQIVFEKGSAKNACERNVGLEHVVNHGGENRCP